MKGFIPELKKILVFLKKDLKIELSYKLSVLLRGLSVILFCLVFFFLARMVEGASIKMLAKYKGNYFSFALIGMAFYSFFAILLNSFSSRLREEQLTGTLEAIFLAPVRLPTLLAGITSFSLVRGMLNMLLFFLVGVFLLGAKISLSNVPIFLLVFVLSVMSFLSIGIIASSFILVFKRGNPINWLLENIFLLAGGVLYPVSVLPEWVRKISDILPITYALRAFRGLLIPGADTTGLSTQITALFVSVLVLFPLAVLSFSVAVRVVKQRGTLSQY
ncbi:ABC transporter permease [Candidatus Omnitrophota bacterium]